MPKKRVSHSPEFKARVALEAIVSSAVGSKTAKQIAEDYNVHQTQVNTWKKQALEGLPKLFERGSSSEDSSPLIDSKAISDKLDKMLTFDDTNDSEESEE